MITHSRGPINMLKPHITQFFKEIANVNSQCFKFHLHSLFLTKRMHSSMLQNRRKREGKEREHLVSLHLITTNKTSQCCCIGSDSAKAPSFTIVHLTIGWDKQQINNTDIATTWTYLLTKPARNMLLSCAPTKSQTSSASMDPKTTKQSSLLKSPCLFCEPTSRHCLWWRLKLGQSRN